MFDVEAGLSTAMTITTTCLKSSSVPYYIRIFIYIYTHYYLIYSVTTLPYIPRYTAIVIDISMFTHDVHLQKSCAARLVLAAGDLGSLK